MLVLDKTKAASYIYPTVSREMTTRRHDFYLEVRDNFSNKGYTMLLPDNISDYQDRYDKFLIDVSLYQDWEVGFYKYTIWEYNSDTSEFITPLETGMLEVQQAEPVAYRSLEEHQNESPNQFKVYQNI